MRSKKDPGFVGVTEAAEYLGVTRAYVRRLALDGKLWFARAGIRAQIYLRESDVVRFGERRGGGRG